MLIIIALSVQVIVFAAALGVRMPHASPIAAFGLRLLTGLLVIGCAIPVVPSAAVVLSSVALALGALGVTVMIVADLVSAVAQALVWRCRPVEFARVVLA